jgi:hypothetical protein
MDGLHHLCHHHHTSDAEGKSQIAEKARDEVHEGMGRLEAIFNAATGISRCFVCRIRG